MAAAAKTLGREDPLGYEIIVDRKIEPAEIMRIKNLPQDIGWRYWLGSHNSHRTFPFPENNDGNQERSDPLARPYFPNYV